MTQESRYVVLIVKVEGADRVESLEDTLRRQQSVEIVSQSRGRPDLVDRGKNEGGFGRYGETTFGRS